MKSIFPRAGLLIAALALAPATRAAELRVGAGGHKTIAAAINAARPGDVVLISAGAYREAVKVPSGITVKAEGEVRIIAAEPLRITEAHDVVVDGLTLVRLDPPGGKGAMPVAAINKSKNIVLRGCRLSIERNAGILVADSEKVRVELSTLHGKGKAIAVAFTRASGEITGNVIAGFNIGVYLSDAKGVAVERNFLEDNQTGVEGSGSTARIIKNVITGRNGSGISLGKSSVTITGNSLRRHFIGIGLAGGSGVIAKNVASQNRFGIFLKGGDWRVFNNTVFFNRGNGLALTEDPSGPGRVEVFENMFSNNSGRGIDASGFGTARIHHNVIDGNGDGIAIEKTTAKILYNTVVLNKTKGVSAKQGSDLVLIANIVAFNAIGVIIDADIPFKSGRNNIYGNLLTKDFPLIDGNFSRYDRLPTRTGEALRIIVMPAPGLRGRSDVSLDPGFVAMGKDYRIKRSSPFAKHLAQRRIGALPLAKK